MSSSTPVNNRSRSLDKHCEDLDNATAYFKAKAHEFLHENRAVRAALDWWRVKVSRLALTLSWLPSHRL